VNGLERGGGLVDPGQGVRTPGLTCEWAGKERRTSGYWPVSEDFRTDL